MNNPVFVYPKPSEYGKRVKAREDEETAQFEHMRRPRKAGLDQIFPETSDWAQSIPAKWRPDALIAKFPRIANLLSDSWRSPRSFDMHLSRLMLDERGTRQGFPIDVLQDLANLRTFYDMVHKPVNADAWKTINGRSDKRY